MVPWHGSENYDLGNGEVEIKYDFEEEIFFKAVTRLSFNFISAGLVFGPTIIMSLYINLNLLLPNLFFINSFSFSTSWPAGSI